MTLKYCYTGTYFRYLWVLVSLGIYRYHCTTWYVHVYLYCMVTKYLQLLGSIGSAQLNVPLALTVFAPFMARVPYRLRFNCRDRVPR